MKVNIDKLDFELACIRHHNKRREQGYATKDWTELEPRVRAEYRAAMAYAWQGLIEVKGDKRVRLTERGLSRVLNGVVGMEFEVDKFTDTGDGKVKDGVAHVRDYRYPQSDGGNPWQIWSLGHGDWEPVT